MKFAIEVQSSKTQFNFVHMERTHMVTAKSPDAIPLVM